MLTMKSFKELLLILSGFLSYSFSKVICYVPRKKDKWAFGALGGLRDNPKYLFYDVIAHHPEINCAWIASNKEDFYFLESKGMPVYYRHSFKGFWYALTAGVYVVDHSTANVSRYLEAGAFYVNLWHGSSVKRVRWQNIEKLLLKYHLKNEDEMRKSFLVKVRTFLVLFRTPNLCLAPSSIQKKEFFAPMMDIPEDNCVVGVYPRSRLMIEGKEAAMTFISKYESEETKSFVLQLQKYRKTFIYMPTWRNDKRDFIEQAGFDWQKLNDVLKQSNSLFILKFHPFTKVNIENLSKYSNICLYPKNSDVYTILPFIDCLITDYSSIYTDFLMMNKEIILYTFDYNEYINGSYELAEFDKYFVGKRANDFTELLDVIMSGEDCHVPQEHYDRLMDFYWDNNRSNIDIAEEIKKRIGL